MLGPKVSQQNIEHITASANPSKWHTRMPDLKENMIHQIRQSSSITPLSSSDAHMLIVGTFSGGIMGILTDLWLHIPVHSKLKCSVWPDTLLSSFSAIWATIAFLLDQTKWASLRSPHASVKLGCLWPWHWSFFKKIWLFTCCLMHLYPTLTDAIVTIQSALFTDYFVFLWTLVSVALHFLCIYIKAKWARVYIIFNQHWHKNIIFL